MKQLIVFMIMLPGSISADWFAKGCDITVGKESVTVICNRPSPSPECSADKHTPECLQTIYDLPPPVWRAECEKELDRRITAYCDGHYCRPPINSLRPEECL